jgi:activator of 2-hydroxyglutaryl-CoA dehydratase
MLPRLASETLGKSAQVPPDPQCIGAFGAALMALEKTNGTP